MVAEKETCVAPAGSNHGRDSSHRKQRWSDNEELYGVSFRIARHPLSIAIHCWTVRVLRPAPAKSSQRSPAFCSPILALSRLDLKMFSFDLSHKKDSEL